MYTQELKVPKDRVGVLIGVKGEFKRRLEKKTGAKIEIDSETGDVTISGEDSIMLYQLKDVVLAVGRGFSDQVAAKLLKEETLLDITNVQDYAGKSKKKLDRLRGRVIGENGRSRRTIEQLSDTDISVYGKTVAVIGEPENVAMARNAIDSLLSGSPHGNVYKWLEKKRRQMTKRAFESAIAH